LRPSGISAGRSPDAPMGFAIRGFAHPTRQSMSARVDRAPKRWPSAHRSVLRLRNSAASLASGRSPSCRRAGRNSMGRAPRPTTFTRSRCSKLRRDRRPDLRFLPRECRAQGIDVKRHVQWHCLVVWAWRFCPVFHVFAVPCPSEDGFGALAQVRGPRHYACPDSRARQPAFRTVGSAPLV